MGKDFSGGMVVEVSSDEGLVAIMESLGGDAL